MSDYDYSDIGVFLLDRQSNVRHLLKGALQQIGFRDIHERSAPAAVRQEIAGIGPDLLILDLDIDRQMICSLMRDIRHGVVGGNPFVVVIATTWSPDEENVRSALNAGADDIVSKPISIQLLTDRVTNLVRHRKEFVATPTYLGPDRRPSRRFPVDGEIETVPVPNSLRHKAIGDQAAAVDEEAIKRASRAVSLQKLRRLAAQVNAMAGRLEQLALEERNRSLKGSKIDELCSLGFQVKEVVADAEIGELSRLTSSMNEVLRGISRSTAPSARQFEILRLHSEAITVLLEGGGEGSELVASALQEAKSVTELRAEAQV